MTTLVRWNPSRSLFNEFDRFFNAPTGNWDAPRAWSLALDVSENDDAYVVKASVPGVSAEDLNITIEDNVLAIKGEVSTDENIEEARYHIRERRHGSFSRSLRFPVDVNADGVEASYVNGVLTLNVPKAEEVKPKQITVKVNA